MWRKHWPDGVGGKNSTTTFVYWQQGGRLWASAYIWIVLPDPTNQSHDCKWHKNLPLATAHVRICKIPPLATTQLWICKNPTTVKKILPAGYKITQAVHPTTTDPFTKRLYKNIIIFMFSANTLWMTRKKKTRNKTGPSTSSYIPKQHIQKNKYHDSPDERKTPFFQL